MNEDNAVMKSKTKHPFLRLLSYGVPYTGWFALALAIILASVWVELYQPKLLGDVVDDFVGRYELVKTDGASLGELKAARADEQS